MRKTIEKRAKTCENNGNRIFWSVDWSWKFPHFLEGMSELENLHCVKSIRIWSFPGPYFPSFGLDTKRSERSLRIQSRYGKKRTKKINSEYGHFSSSAENAGTKFYLIRLSILISKFKLLAIQVHQILKNPFSSHVISL